MKPIKHWDSKCPVGCKSKILIFKSHKNKNTRIFLHVYILSIISQPNNVKFQNIEIFFSIPNYRRSPIINVNCRPQVYHML